MLPSVSRTSSARPTAPASPARQRLSIPATGLLALASVLLAAGGCGSPDRDARKVADQLATGLAAHDLAAVPLSSAAARDRYNLAVDAVDDVPTSVEADDVRVAGERATAVLSWAWDLGGTPWRYRTEARLAYDGDRWEVDWDPATLAPRLRAGERLDVDRLAPRRGDILGRGGRPIVTERAVIRLGLDKSRVPARRWPSSAARIAKALDIDSGSYLRKVRAYGDEAFVEGIVLRAEDARTDVEPSYRSIPGAIALEDEIPLAPTREFAAPVLGSVGPATAETIERSHGEVAEGTEVGYSGLQARYDDQLRGEPGVRVQAVGRDGATRTLFERAARDGRDLETTLDLDLQRRAEQALADHVGPQGPDSALVALRPSTGEVLVAANGPANDGLNAATAGQYAPGSTFKVVTALALLRQGATPETVGSCPSTTVVDGRRFKNYDDYPLDRLGEITLAQAVANSCNTFFIGSWQDLPDQGVAEAAAALGMGVDHDLGFPAYFGQVPPATGATEKAADLIGQGKVLASPLTMATVAASVAAGHAVLPRLLPAHRVRQQPPARPLTGAETEQLRAMMRAVVTEGSGRFLLDRPEAVGAKTGTAEYGQPTADGSLRTHTWMIATEGDLAVAVFVETGESGSQTAGPILDEFLP